MHNHQTEPIHEHLPAIILVGNPNVGKSVIFQRLTGKYVTVSNYPGTTVEISEGLGKFAGKKFRIIDTPGINSLIPKSEDERVTRDILFDAPLPTIVQIADSKNLNRALLLTFQLIELNLPIILVLNMADEAKERGIKIQLTQLSQQLRIPVIETVAITGQGIGELKSKIHDARCMMYDENYKLHYGDKIESTIEKIQELLPQSLQGKRSIATMLLSGDETILEMKQQTIRLTAEQRDELQSMLRETQQSFGKPLAVVITEKQIRAVQDLVDRVTSYPKIEPSTFRETLSRLTLHPVSGLVTVFIVLYLMYQFVGKFAAGTGVDFLQNTIFRQYLNPYIIQLVERTIPIQFMQQLLVGEYGLVTMALTYAFAIIFPIVTAFFVFFGFLEDSGYLPRLAVMSDRLFRRFGLHGKAVLPMVLGLGCGTMAVLTSRILDTKKERLLAIILLGLAIPCSAQLGVILAMLSAVSWQAMLVWLSSIIISLFLVGYFAGKIIPGTRSNFLIELPPLRFPQFKNILLKTGTRIRWYLKEAVPLFILGTLILFLLNSIHALGWIERLAAPVIVHLLGLPEQVTESFLIGFLRRDYGAAGLLVMTQHGQLNARQIVVSAVAITLFIPCIAQLLVTIKEQGITRGMLIFGLVTMYALLFSGMLNSLLTAVNF